MQIDKHKRYQFRRSRVRKKIIGTIDRPRLCVRRSLHHIYAQIIDDTHGTSLVAISTLAPELKNQLTQTGTGNISAAKLIGEHIGKLALAKGIKKIVFDRGGRVYHGRIKAVAAAARNTGLIF